MSKEEERFSYRPDVFKKEEVYHIVNDLQGLFYSIDKEGKENWLEMYDNGRVHHLAWKGNRADAINKMNELGKKGKNKGMLLEIYKSRS